MSPRHAIALCALALPLSALAQTYYTRPAELRVLPEEVRSCFQRNDALWERRIALEREREAVNVEADSLARTGADLDGEWRSMDRSNAPLVASYNARSDRHNRRVEAQNRRVADFNARIALLNGDTDDAVYQCSAPYLPPDRDATWRERNRLR